MFAGPDGTKLKTYAGFYLRTSKRMFFWGWGKPSSSPQLERPWASLGDWLRMAHSRYGTRDSAQPASEAQAVTVVEQGPTEIAPPKKRTFNFVCNRRFVGLVIR